MLMYYTERENLERQKENLHILDQQLANGKFGVEDIADLLPGVFHMNTLKDASLQYMSKAGEQYFGLTYQEMIELGIKRLNENYHPTTIKEIIPQFIEFGKNNDIDKVNGYSHLVRRNSEHDYEQFVGFAKISDELKSFVCIEYPVTDFGELSNKMATLIDDNQFLRKNYKKFASLTKREIEIIRLIGYGKTRTAISEQLNISKHTFDNHRKHIREKLKIKTAAELFQYIRAFDLC